MRLALFALLFGFGFAAQAQDAGEFGLRYWYSSGKSTRSHNAQDLVPSLGNPTSVLTYTNLDAHAVELYGRKSFAEGSFLKGNAGIGTITGGSLRDEDFEFGQVIDTDTISTVKGNGIGYATLDVGHTFWRTSNGSAGIFVGFHYWRERVDAYGVVFTVPPAGAAVPDSVPAITNEVTWQSLRVGLTSTAEVGSSTRLSADLAFVPYAKVRDEDSHWLRQDPTRRGFLGQAPNIHMDGHGYGFQLDLDLGHALGGGWEIGGGLRYWWLRAENGTRVALGTSVPIVEIESQRLGITLSVTKRW